MTRHDRRIVVLMGPTASGKSDVAIEIARRTGGEIVSGDAFAVYRGFDIGTAKPTRIVREEIPHHLIDVEDPRESYSAGRWAREARRAIEGIEERGRLPIVAGGSHFYLRALLGNLPPGEIRNEALRVYLRATISADSRGMRKRSLDFLDPVYSRGVPAADTARLNRAIEIIFSTGCRVSGRSSGDGEWISKRRVLKISLQIPREELYTRIHERIMRMWHAGWPQEVQMLQERGTPPTAPGFRAIGYETVRRYQEGRLSEEEAIGQIEADTRSLAKRQRTWLTRERDVLTLPPPLAVEEALGFWNAAGSHE